MLENRPSFNNLFTCYKPQQKNVPIEDHSGGSYPTKQLLYEVQHTHTATQMYIHIYTYI